MSGWNDQNVNAWRYKLPSSMCALQNPNHCLYLFYSINKDQDKAINTTSYNLKHTTVRN